MSECQTTNRRVPGAEWLNWAILGNLITIMHRGLCNIPSASAPTPIPPSRIRTHTHTQIKEEVGWGKAFQRVRRLWTDTHWKNRKRFHGRCFNHDSWANKPFNSQSYPLGSEHMTILHDQRLQWDRIKFPLLFFCFYIVNNLLFFRL